MDQKKSAAFIFGFFRAPPLFPVLPQNAFTMADQHHLCFHRRVAGGGGGNKSPSIGALTLLLGAVIPIWLQQLHLHHVASLSSTTRLVFGGTVTTTTTTTTTTGGKGSNAL